MQRVIQFLFLLILFFLISCKVSLAQETPPQEEFLIGAFLSSQAGDGVKASYDSSGLNTVAWRADNNTSSFLENYKVWANNAGWTDWIQYYATSYYSRWQAEQDTTIEHVGFKHKYGQKTTWHDTLCWSTFGLSSPADSIVYGPHYRQDMRHKSYFHTGNTWGVDYIPRFNLALYNPDSLDSTRNICVIKVVYRYAAVYNQKTWILHDTIFLQDTLKISEFPPNGSFKIFNVWQNDTNYYRYPEKFYSIITGDRVTMSAVFPDTIAPVDTIVGYEDRNADNGIQFCVDYLGNDSTTLFIDWAEVYDRQGWDKYMDPLSHDPVIDSIQAYTQRYSNWSNIIYWYGQDEPYSLDSYMPIHIVDSLLLAFFYSNQ
jgi:hypothetical protein